MVKVENRDTLWLLTVRFLKNNRGRSRIAVLAIVLTTTLFTSLFTGAVSMMLSKLEADKKTYSAWSHVVLQDVTRDEAQRVSDVLEKSDFVERFGVNTFVGTLQDERIPFQTEVRAADWNAASAFCNAPVQGRLPEKKDEIALSSLVLDALGIEYRNPMKNHDKITLTIAIDNADGKEELVTHAFYLCGWWEGDASDYSQYAWVSETSAGEIVPGVTRDALEHGAMSGAVGFSVWYKNLWNLRQKTDELGKRCLFLQTGAQNGGFQINPAYEGLIGGDGMSLSGVFSLILLIVLAGYLIIYNIFSISIKTDLRTYGLLKNVGTTGRQLARIVHMQAFCLCLAGIPAGLFMGYGCGVLISPALTADIDSLGHLRQTTVSTSPFIFAAAAVLALVTVYLSCIQACRIVARVSPVEALCIAEGGQAVSRAKRRADGVRERNMAAAWWGMALGNFRRIWKRGMIVMVSIALSLVMLNGIFMMVRGYDLDAYQRVYMASDFAVDRLPAYAPYAVMDAITSDIQAQLNVCPYAERIGYVRYSEEYHEMEPHLYQVWEQIAQERLSGRWLESWEQMKAENQMKIMLMGIDRAVFDKLEWCGTACTWETFSRGDGVIVDSPLLEVVGMTKRQICKMLMAEGCLYLFGAFLLAVSVTVLFGAKLLTAALGQAFFFNIKVTVLPCVVLLPFLVVVAVLIPLGQFWQMSQESVVERL